MILAFKPQFIEKIKKGIKIHTIREDKGGRWIPQRAIQMATGVRTKNYLKFNDEICLSVQSIEIKYAEMNFLVDGKSIAKTNNTFMVAIDNRILSNDEVITLAINDGFKDLDEFKEWFTEDFYGKIIHWTDFKY
jgi:hypothetical protein